MMFDDVSVEAGVSLNAIGWATIFMDYDNDGLQDMYLATYNTANETSDRLFHNRGDGRFSDISIQSGVSNPQPTIGAAAADFDRDGLLDLVVGNHNEGFRLYHNQHVGTHHWIGVELDGGNQINRNAIGSRVQVKTAGGRQQIQAVRSGGSIGSGNALGLHFGLGESTQADLDIIWADGVQQSISLDAGHHHLLTHPVFFKNGFE